MRIVHEIQNKEPQCTGSGHLYAHDITKPPPEFPGFSLDLLASDSDEDNIYIEGNGLAIKKTLKSLLAIVESLECEFRTEWANTIIPQCPKCECWTANEHACFELMKCNCSHRRQDHEDDGCIICICTGFK